jgi:hypothetical protein
MGSSYLSSVTVTSPAPSLVFASFVSPYEIDLGAALHHRALGGLWAIADQRRASTLRNRVVSVVNAINQHALERFASECMGKIVARVVYPRGFQPSAGQQPASHHKRICKLI